MYEQKRYSDKLMIWNPGQLPPDWTVFHFTAGHQKVDDGIGEAAQETTQEKILGLLKSHPSITRKELAAKVGLGSDGIEYHLEKNETEGDYSAYWGNQIGLLGGIKIMLPLS